MNRETKQPQGGSTIKNIRSISNTEETKNRGVSGIIFWVIFFVSSSSGLRPTSQSKISLLLFIQSLVFQDFHSECLLEKSKLVLTSME